MSTVSAAFLRDIAISWFMMIPMNVVPLCKGISHAQPLSSTEEHSVSSTFTKSKLKDILPFNASKKGEEARSVPSLYKGVSVQYPQCARFLSTFF